MNTYSGEVWNVQEMGQTSLESLAVVNGDDVGSERNASLSGDFDVTLWVLQNVAFGMLVNIQAAYRTGWLEPLTN